MAFSGNYMCTSFKKELLQGDHDLSLGGNLVLIALYTNSATFNAATTQALFGAGNNEVATSGGYTSGGPTVASASNSLVQTAPATGGTTAFLNFGNKTFSSSTITARGALLYNSQTNGGANTDNTICVLDFGADKSSTTGDFQIVFPVNDENNALIRIA